MCYSESNTIAQQSISISAAVGVSIQDSWGIGLMSRCGPGRTECSGARPLNDFSAFLPEMNAHMVI